MMRVSVRKMQPADHQAWAEMRHRLWSGLSAGEHLEEIREMLAGDIRYSGYIAITDSGQIAGFAEISIRGYANGCTSRPVPFLEGIWVAPGYQRRGIGQALIRAISQDLLRQGFAELGSDADIANIISHHAHARWGFEERERVVYFRKLLNP